MNQCTPPPLEIVSIAKNIQQRETEISMYKIKYVPNCLRLLSSTAC